MKPTPWTEEPATDEDLASLREPMSEWELREALDLYRWFTRRYRTAGERLDYSRRAYASAMRWHGLLAPESWRR